MTNASTTNILTDDQTLATDIQDKKPQSIELPYIERLLMVIFLSLSLAMILILMIYMAGGLTTKQVTFSHSGGIVLWLLSGLGIIYLNLRYNMAAEAFKLSNVCLKYPSGKGMAFSNVPVPIMSCADWVLIGAQKGNGFLMQPCLYLAHHKDNKILMLFITAPTIGNLPFNQNVSRAISFRDILKTLHNEKCFTLQNKLLQFIIEESNLIVPNIQKRN